MRGIIGATGLILALMFMGGCAESAVGTDPALGIAYTDQGVEADVHADAQKVQEASQAVLARLGYRQEGDHWKVGIATVHMKITQNGLSSHIEVIAKTNTLAFPQDFAAQVLQDIVQSSS